MIASTSFFEQWKPIKSIGQGSTCEVILAQNNTTKKTEVVKLFNNPEKYDTAEQEAKLLLSLDHKRILGAKAFYPKMDVPNSNDNRSLLQLPAISLEYASNGDLLGLIQEGGGLPEQVARSYFHQLVDALGYIHSKDICHLDIKPDNILVDSEYGLKLADFGLSMKVPKDCSVKGAVGTSIYYAPEIHLKAKYSSYSADIFALGICLFVMISGHMPFTVAKSTDSMYKLIIEERHDEFWNFHQGLKKSKTEAYSASFRDLLQSMLAFNPKRRLTLEQIKEHEWFQASIASDEKLTELVEALFTK